MTTLRNCLKKFYLGTIKEQCCALHNVKLAAAYILISYDRATLKLVLAHLKLCIAATHQ